jgi:hypothetical protein
MADRNIKISDFDGDNMSILEWLQSVRMCSAAAGWEDDATCERAKLHLTGRARTWLQNRIMANTPGINAWDPPVVAGAKPPNLQHLLTNRFLQAVTPTEQARLRLTLTQNDGEDASSFYDRCEATQFALDATLPEAFRTAEASKANYDIVRGQNILQNFINGLKHATRNHVTTLNVRSATEALDAAIAFEQANAKNGKIAATSIATQDPDTEFVAKVAALVLRGGGNHRGRGGSQGKDKGCFYCGFLGHWIKVCNSKKSDEARGIFQSRSSTYSPGRIGTRGRGRGRGSDRGMDRGYPSRGGRGGYGGGTHAYTERQQQIPPNMGQPQEQQMYQQQQPFVPQPSGSTDTQQQAAFRYFPAGN